MTAPLIGLGVPVFNGEDYLADCLASIAAQDHERIDVVISDNASTDRTEEICREVVARDDRFRYVRQPTNLGAAANYNEVLRRSRGDLFKFAAHDDLLGPGFLRLCAEALEEHPEAVVAFPGTRYIDADGSTLGDYDDQLTWTHASTASGRLRDLYTSEDRTLLRLCYPIMGVMRRDAALTTRGIQAFRAADAAMLVELALLGDFVELPEPLYLKRLHPDTSMRANSTPEDFARWYDPRAQRPPLHATRLAVSDITAPLRVPLPAAERLRCVAAGGAWLAREKRWRVVAAELRDAATARLRARD